MPITASARPLNGSVRQEVDVNGRHRIWTDEPASLGGTDAAPSPDELLPAMVAACVSTMIALHARRHEWDLGEAWVDVGYDPETAPRRVEVTVHLPAGLTPDQLEQLRRVVATGPVMRAFEAGFAVTEELTVDLPPAASGPTRHTYIEPWPAGGWAVRLRGHPAPVSRHDTEEEAEARAAAYARGLDRDR
jgi:putative redox protein